MQAVGYSTPINITDDSVLLVSAGLLVGFGTYIGNGCTSGHGVCGMGRLSFRSFVATLTFIGAGIVTVAVMNALGMGL
ncbi:YeeE/YedE family protein [Thalassolituus sp. UBA3500]|uniref:YeeE/YedE family protein n=1 Tax=Thalassolituus sp. UBA3500 TaxID=1947664 RepID=UPI00263A93B9|nr:YeeE/YedE thiosulfate transporter family protein [Thalassolituus sp. UBA3500]|tara:strand:- start:571 stop:804 length:234 start_codon:yes stop_codon:yes gene_type:complete